MKALFFYFNSFFPEFMVLFFLTKWHTFEKTSFLCIFLKSFLVNQTVSQKFFHLLNIIFT